METFKYYENRIGIMDFDFEEVREIDAHFHQDIEILYVLEGNAQVNVCENVFELKTNDVILIDGNQKHSYISKEDVLIGIIHINYGQLNQYINMKNNYFKCNSSIDKNDGYQELRELLNRIFKLYFDKQEEAVYLNSLYFSLLHILISNFSYKYDNKMPNNSNTSEENRINEIIYYINNNYQYPISLNDLADQLYLSTAYLSKYIKRKLGMNFINYLNNVRLSNALNEMKTSKKSLTKIALDNGFPNTTAFSTAFKKEYNMTPSSWIKKHKEEHVKEKEKINNDFEKKGDHIKTFIEKSKSIKDKPYKENDKVFSVDINNKYSNLKNTNRMINIGSITNLLRSDLQQHILILKKELGFKYVRFWDIFDNKMLLDIKRIDGKYNFTRIDKALDFIINNGMHPFIELGFKPVALLRNVYNTIVSEEKDIIFKSQDEYREVIYSLVAHCVNRYGLEEVESWYFEQWGDPRITSGKGYGTYFEVFETIYHTIKSISPKIKIGGVGFGRLYSTLDFKDILKLWKKRICHPDFISLYGYPYMARSDNESQNDVRIRDANFINNHVMMIKEVLEEISLHTPELMITEWSFSVSDWNSLNDSVFKGAFILKNIIDNIDCVDLMGYWLASDILGEYFDNSMILHGGNGLLSAHGIRKPAFYAIKFANKLGRYMLGKDNNSIITSNESGDYYIACHNYVHPNFKYYLKKEDEVEVQKQFLLFDDAEVLKLGYRIKNVKNGKYMIKIRSLNQDHGSVQDEWGEMRYNENLNQQDIEYLKDISTPKIYVMEQTVSNNILNIDTSLKPHEIQHIQITYQI